MFNSLINILLNLSQDIGYSGIVLLMAIESSFFPFPSELVIPPAAYLASEGKFNIFFVILSGIIGSIIGAVFNYILAITLGRKIVYKLAEHKFSRLILINKKNIEKSEQFFLKYGNVSTFIGRLIPAIRQLISLPAGFSKMNFYSFLFFTSLGSGIWVSVLALLGYLFGAQKQLFSKYYHQISLGFCVLGFFVIAIIIYRSYKSKSK